MKPYTFDELSDILDNVTCLKDVEEIEDYLAPLDEPELKQSCFVWRLVLAD